MTVKSLLAQTVQAYFGNVFLPETYDLTKDYDAFMGHYLSNES